MIALGAVVWSGGDLASQSPIDCRTRAGFDKEICVVSGKITSDITFDSGSYYVLRGAVFVESGATLTLEPGTEVFGEFATNGTLIITRGSRIHSNGTAAAPVVFSSDQPLGERARADWGGLIINGDAPLNVPGGTSVGEGDTGVYGGSDPDDDSGHLRYTRVEFAGTEFSPDNELNGIAFQGVGRNTEVDYVQVSFNKDDGMEFFGGTVEVSHVICYGIADDSFDWTDGWHGKGQFMVALQSGDDADQGIEADNNGDNRTLTPRSNPTLYNLTLLGDPDTDEGSESDTGILLREGTSATIRNFIVHGFKEASIDVDHGETFRQITDASSATPLTIASGIVNGNCEVSNCVGEFRPDRDDDDHGIVTMDWVTGSSNVTTAMDPMLVDPFNLGNPDISPAAGSPAISGAVTPTTPPDDGFFDTTATFIGAVGPAGSGHDTWWIAPRPARRVDRLCSELSSMGSGFGRRAVAMAAAAACLACGAGCGAPPRADDPSPLQWTFESPEQVAEAVLDALAARDVERLEALALSEIEFRTVVWPELPSSRPERGLPFEYAWGDLHQKSNNELRRLIAREAGRRYDLLAVEFDGESTTYETYAVHRDSRLVVRGEDGADEQVRLFGSILERSGAYKLFSYVVD